MSPISLSSNALALQKPADARFGPRFAEFVALTNLMVRTLSEDQPELCARVTAQLRSLLADDKWIPADLTVPVENTYRRECLYEAHDGSFSIGVFTWVAGHVSRIHDHHSWAVLGNITGTLRSENFLSVSPGRAFKHTEDDLLQPGQALWSTRNTGDIHRVSVASPQTSTSIHVYGCSFDAVNREYYAEIV